MASIYLGLLTIAFCSLTGQAQNINCGLRTRRVVTVENGTSYTLTTQRKGEEEYKDGTECRVLYKQGPTCRTMQFSCDKVAVKAKWNQPSKTSAHRFCFGDFMRVRRYGESTRYCRGEKPSVTSTGPITVFFKSNPKIVSTGAECKIECIEDFSAWVNYIESPGYPELYGGQYFLGELNAPPGHIFRFTYVDFEVNCTAVDGFYLEDDAETSAIDNDLNLGRQCGSRQDTDVFLSNSNLVKYIFIMWLSGPPIAPQPGIKVKWEVIQNVTMRMDSKLGAMDYDLEELEKEYSW